MAALRPRPMATDTEEEMITRLAPTIPDTTTRPPRMPALTWTRRMVCRKQCMRSSTNRHGFLLIKSLGSSDGWYSQPYDLNTSPWSTYHDKLTNEGILEPSLVVGLEVLGMYRSTGISGNWKRGRQFGLSLAALDHYSLGLDWQRLDSPNPEHS
jgi:hypothetical protein